VTINAAFFSMLVTLLTLAALTSGIAMTRMTIHRLSEDALAAGYQRAADALRQTLQTRLQNGPMTLPLPTVAPIAPACAQSPGTCYQTAATVTLRTLAASAASCDPALSNCARNVETNPYVGEQRLAARITVTVSAPDGTVLAARSTDNAVRTLQVPPYVILTGSVDGTFDGTGAAAAGDDGGTLPATPNPCGTAPLGSSDDTVVRVAYRNVQSNACSDGSVWQNAPYDAPGPAPAGWSP
jgi:hypothetical protein